MKKSSASKIQLAGFDDLFGKNENLNEQIIEVSINELHPFKNHPFKVIQDEKMKELVESIKERGVLVPCIVRKSDREGYVLISGHRRTAACKIAGLETIKVMVKEVTDDEATIIMVDSNIQRENLLYSERAYAYKMKFEAMKHQGSKGNKITTAEIGEEVGESGRQIQRYIRLTELSQPLLDFVDEKKIGFIPGVDLSYLKANEQDWVYDKIVEKGIFPSGSQVLVLKKYSESLELTVAMVDMILSEEKLLPKKVTLSSDKINQFFSKEYSKQDIEAVIYQLLDEWKKSQ